MRSHLRQFVGFWPVLFGYVFENFLDNMCYLFWWTFDWEVRRLREVTLRDGDGINNRATLMQLEHDIVWLRLYPRSYDHDSPSPFQVCALFHSRSSTAHAGTSPTTAVAFFKRIHSIKTVLSPSGRLFRVALPHSPDLQGFDTTIQGFPSNRGNDPGRMCLG